MTVPRTPYTPAPWWLLEAALSLAVAWAIAWGLGSQPAAAGLLAAAVVLVGAQHGLVAGVVTGAAAAGMALYGAGGTIADVLELSGRRGLLLPAYLHVALGALAGLAGEGHRRVLAGVLGELRRQAVERADLAERAERLIAEKAALERRFAREALPLETLSAEAGLLAGQPADNLLPATLALTVRFLGACSAAYYAFQGDELVLDTHLGPAPASIATGVAARAGYDGRPLAARTPEEGADGWLAAPVLRADGSCRGVLVVLDLPFERLTDDALAQLAELARHLGQALQQERDAVQVEIREVQRSAERDWADWREAS